MSDKINQRVSPRRKGDRRRTKGKRPHNLPERRTRGERRRVRDRRS